jgi:hypothetical protein
MPTPPPDVTTLTDAIDAFRSLALTSFNAGRTDALSGQVAGQSDAAWEQKKSKGKAQMQSALDQLAHADTMAAEHAIAAAVTAVSDKVKELVDANAVSSDANQLNRERELGIFGTMLTNLAAIAPVVSGKSGGSGG